jgi:hypothetical protein
MKGLYIEAEEELRDAVNEVLEPILGSQAAYDISNTMDIPYEVIEDRARDMLTDTVDAGLDNMRDFGGEG